MIYTAAFASSQVLLTHFGLAEFYVNLDMDSTILYFGRENSGPNYLWASLHDLLTNHISVMCFFKMHLS